MKHLTFASILLGFSIFMSCDDNTGEMGTSLISKMDELNISTDTFYVKSRSVVADSVYARNAIGYLGPVALVMPLLPTRASCAFISILSLVTHSPP